MDKLMKAMAEITAKAVGGAETGQAPHPTEESEGISTTSTNYLKTQESVHYSNGDHPLPSWVEICERVRCSEDLP